MHARRDRDRAGSGGGRTPQPEARLLFRLSVVFLLRFAERRLSGVLFQDPRRTTRRQGPVQASRIMAGSNRSPRKIARRRRHVSACAACAIQAPTRGYEMIETVEIKIGKKLAGQVADGQAAAAPERLE